MVAANVDEMSSSSSSTTDAPPSKPTEETNTAAPVVRMRNKPPLTPTQTQATNGNALNDSAQNVLQRGLEALNELAPESEDGTDEIKKLDSQLDHLNHYMDKVEERIRAHNEKLMDTLRHQKEQREKRRQSFHERMQLSQQEDDDFQRQISSLLNRVDISKNRASMYDIISTMEIPKISKK